MKFVPGTYFAFKLSEKSRKKILELFPVAHSNVVCHHVTIEFNLTPEKLAKYNFSGDTEVKVIGEGRAPGVQALLVSIDNQRFRADGGFYHLTLSLEPPHRPVESNKVTKDQMQWLKGSFSLEGEFVLLKK
jgi:hypothetical protein